MDHMELDNESFGIGQYHECLLPEPDYVSSMDPHLYRFFKERVLDKSEEEIKQEESYEQGSEGWKRARNVNPRLPASTWSKITKHCPYTLNHQTLLQEMLYSTFEGNEYTEHGTQTEPVARSQFILEQTKILRKLLIKSLRKGDSTFIFAGKKVLIPKTFLHGEDSQKQSEEESVDLSDDTIQKYFLQVTVTGLHVSRKQKWLSCSSDGDINTDILLEIKCPFKKGYEKPYPLIPLYYYDQLQGNMHLRGRDRIFFYVYTRTETTCELIHYDPSYCNGFLIPSLNRFYFTMFLPAFFQREQTQHALMVGLNGGLENSTTATTTTTTTTADENEQPKKDHQIKQNSSNAWKKRKIMCQ